MDSDLDPKLMSLISELVSSSLDHDWREMLSLTTQIVSLVSSMGLDTQQKKLESELMSLIRQTIFLFNSMDMDCQPKPLSELISLVSQKLSRLNFMCRDSELAFLFIHTLRLEPEPELMSLIHQICSLAISMDLGLEKFISLCTQVEVTSDKGELKIKELPTKRYNKWSFVSRGCKGKNYEGYEKAPADIKHPLHPKHSLRLVFLEYHTTMPCYICQENLKGILYCCLACNFAIDLACLKKRHVLSIEQPKWHEHTLSLFPSKASLPCNLCSLNHSRCPFYICPPCDFVVHKSCIKLPRIIRISRHHHRISFTPSFAQGDWFCGVCRRKINNDFGGYSCIKDGCSYAAHSKCATRSNVWDGIELEGEPEESEDEQEDEPFVRISDTIIHHFSHQQHLLKLDHRHENTGEYFDEDIKQCEACIMPIYFGKFYSCTQCDFILHEACANLSRRIHHPIHAHPLTLVGAYDGVMDYLEDRCSACAWMCRAGFFYECSKEGCSFTINVQCATVSEPLVSASHKHPLFLTSEPGDWRMCSLCNFSDLSKTNETFNCIESECNFSLCFSCATIPQEARYKHDKHTLTLSPKKERSYARRFVRMYLSWCEVCEEKVYADDWFYKCDEYYCVTLHVDCLLGNDRDMKPGSSFFYLDRKVDVLPNNHHMSRPICFTCRRRCPQKIVFQMCGLILCSTFCMRGTHPRELT
ncbi:hypothetical protein BRARA_D01111 [Brassica rapa]|uniref:Phorbol-ester/DAG-type domain-containing protein n=1 Tax=Brassica campestris TaxID=3711 RepID=A0A397ZKG5_BRACM|nr:hypothetical protein BRARA_D01111 [Brassica rapa]